MATSISVQVTNQLPNPLTVYTKTTKPVSDPPSTDPADYTPIYTRLGSVPANGAQTLDTGTLVSNLVITRANDDFPVKYFVPDILGPPTQPVAVGGVDLSSAGNAWRFYMDLMAQPYSPVALQFHELLLDPVNINTLDSQVSALLASDYPGADFFGFSMVSYWATNSLFAWPGAYYCYTVSPLTSAGFIGPPVAAGSLSIGTDGRASFTASDGGTSYPSLTYANGKLSSPGANSSSGIIVTGIFRKMTWEGHPDISGMFWVGTRDGKPFILQPYQDPALPWWVAAYNLAFGAFLDVQIAMTVDMAVHVLKGVAQGFQWLAQNAVALYGKIRSAIEEVSATADPDAGVGEDVDPINVDVDVDTDVDVDVDVVTDVDNVTDADTDVDIDIDIDIDDDVFAIIDVDVDVDVDIDIDVVTDVDNVTDTDTDVDIDVDVDTDVNVPPGGIKALLSRLGFWIMTKGLPALVENAAIMGAMMASQKLLEVWKKSDEQSLENMSPQESTGLGLLLNYMLNANVSEAKRWTTFADYIQQAQPDTGSQRMLLAMVLMFKNDAADSEAKAWNWPQSTEQGLEQQMAQHKTADQQYQAYLMLAGYTYQGKPLPVKIAAGVATRYLAMIADHIADLPGIIPRASSSASGASPAYAVDGNPNTMWNSGGPPPAWIELDLQRTVTLSKARLLVEQSPAGPTIHQLYFGPLPGPTALIATLSGSTSSMQWLEVDVPDPKPSGRYLRVLTTASPSWVAWREIVVQAQ